MAEDQPLPMSTQSDSVFIAETPVRGAAYPSNSPGGSLAGDSPRSKEIHLLKEALEEEVRAHESSIVEWSKKLHWATSCSKDSDCDSCAQLREQVSVIAGQLEDEKRAHVDTLMTETKKLAIAIGEYEMETQYTSPKQEETEWLKQRAQAETISNLETLVFELKRDLADQETTYNVVLAKLNTLQKEKSEETMAHEQSLMDFSKKVSHKTAELETATQRVSELEARCEELKYEVSSLRNELNEHEKGQNERTAIVEDRDILKEESCRLRDMLNILEKESKGQVLKMTEESNRLFQELEAVKKEKSEETMAHEQSLMDFSKKVSHKTAELETATQRVSELEARCEELKYEVSSLRNELNEHEKGQNERTAIVEDRDILKEESCRLRDMLNILEKESKGQVLKMTEESNRLFQELEAVKKEKSEETMAHEQSLMDFSKKVSRKTAELETATQRVSELEARCEELSTEKESLQQGIDYERGALDEWYRARISCLEDELQESQKSMLDEKSMVEQLRNELNSVQTVMKSLNEMNEDRQENSAEVRENQGGDDSSLNTSSMSEEEDCEKDLRETVTILKENLALEDENVALKKQLDALVEEHANTHKQMLKQMEYTAEQLHDSNEEATAGMRKMAAILEDTRKQNSMLEREVDHWKQDSSQNMAMYIQERLRNIPLQAAAIGALRMGEVQLKHELAGLQKSLSESEQKARDLEMQLARENEAAYSSTERLEAQLNAAIAACESLTRRISERPSIEDKGQQTDSSYSALTDLVETQQKEIESLRQASENKESSDNERHSVSINGMSHIAVRMAGLKQAVKERDLRLVTSCMDDIKNMRAAMRAQSHGLSRMRESIDSITGANSALKRTSAKPSKKPTDIDKENIATLNVKVTTKDSERTPVKKAPLSTVNLNHQDGLRPVLVTR